MHEEIIEDPDEYILTLFQHKMGMLTDEDNILTLEYDKELETTKHYSRKGLGGVSIDSTIHTFDVITEDCKTATIQITEDGKS